MELVDQAMSNPPTSEFLPQPQPDTPNFKEDLTDTNRKTIRVRHGSAEFN